MKKIPSLLIAVPVIVLLLYAAISKLADFENFRFGISESPFINQFAGPLAWAVPAVEILIVLLLIFPASRFAGFWSSLILLIVFTIYISAMLLFASEIPCSCGGVLEQMSWPVHIVFNLLFIILALAGIRSERKRRNSITSPNKQVINTYAKGYTTAAEPH